MPMIQDGTLPPDVLPYLCNVAIAAVLIAGCGVAASFACRRRSAPLQHGLLLSSLVVTILSPLFVSLAQSWEVGPARITITRSRNIDRDNRSRLPLRDWATHRPLNVAGDEYGAYAQISPLGDPVGR